MKSTEIFFVEVSSEETAGIIGGSRLRELGESIGYLLGMIWARWRRSMGNPDTQSIR